MPKSDPSIFSLVHQFRNAYLEGINKTILGRNHKISKKTLAKRRADGWKGGPPVSGADVGSAKSMWIMEHWAEQLPGSLGALGTSQTSGSTYESLLEEFLNKSFTALAARGLAAAENLSATRGTQVESYDQYAHLADINQALRGSEELRALFGRSYGVKPDIIVALKRLHPSEIGGRGRATEIARYSPFFSDAEYARNSQLLRKRSVPEASILKAIVSCKLTLRSDRAQNVRPEANAAMRLRRGRVPAIVAITAEPMIGRLESLALGTGEIDCVYHSALPELECAMEMAGDSEGLGRLREIIRTRRMRDVSDLLFDVML